MPRQRIDDEQNHRQEQQKYAVDHFTTGLVGNPKIRENYLNCFLDNGPCSPEANNIKRKYTLKLIEITKNNNIKLKKASKCMSLCCIVGYK